MHEQPFQPRARSVIRQHLPVRERLRLSNRKRASLVVAMLVAAPILYLLSAILSAQP
ncbi:hypothetical protein [Janthinobacterium sp. Ant5-2-1]|uniref:hypothetical protein n=1 Tax=Janthinobacterium sp. Ant5-2-1 TaxID=1755239 RepID=UPI000A887314|nr:hypothetical protein [Janthinobacterium sp. Ant5-2-1]